MELHVQPKGKNKGREWGGGNTNIKNKLILDTMAEIEFNFRRRAKFISNIYIYINKRYEISGVLG